MSWRWIDRRALVLLHDESLAEHGGAAGLRDEGLPDSALSRPQNLAADENPDLAQLAACYCMGLARNHPFVDGSKRASFLAMGLLLHLNGWRLQATQADATTTLLAVAAGDIDESELACWIRNLSARR